MIFTNSHHFMHKKKTILLVEDEAVIALNEAKLLKKHGFNVITVYTAQKAIAEADAEKITAYGYVVKHTGETVLTLPETSFSGTNRVKEFSAGVKKKL